MDVVEWSRALDVRLSEWCCSVSMVRFKSRRGKNKNLTALKSNSNTVWFNFQTYLYIYIYKRLKCSTTTLKKMLKCNKNNYKSTKRL